MSDSSRASSKRIRKPLVFEMVYAEKNDERLWEEVSEYLIAINFFGRNKNTVGRAKK